MARVVGSVISMYIVFEEESMFRSRYLQEVIKYRDVNNLGWDELFNIRDTGVEEQAREELQYLMSNVDKLNRRNFQSKLIQALNIFGDAGGTAMGGMWR